MSYLYLLGLVSHHGALIKYNNKDDIALGITLYDDNPQPSLSTGGRGLNSLRMAGGPTFHTRFSL